MSNSILPTSGIKSAEECIDLLEAQLKSFIQDNNIQNPLFVGIRTGGAWVAEQLHQRLNSEHPLSNHNLGALDISFYRDDFSQRGLNPQVKGSELPDSIEGENIILIDDVLMTGRTIRAAMNELFDYGRPASIHLAVLVDVGRRELPIQADIVGTKIELQDSQLVKIEGPTPLTLSIVDKA